MTQPYLREKKQNTYDAGKRNDAEAYARPCASAMRQKLRHASILSMIVVDVGSLRQILYNTCLNAVKFTRDGGSVRVGRAPADTTQFRIEIEDNDIGIRSKICRSRRAERIV
jgi:signal transduction histidine kinase